MTKKLNGAHRPAVDEDRRRFLATCGRFAAVTPPAMTLLLSTSTSSDAIARSGAGRMARNLMRRENKEDDTVWVLVVEDDGKLRDQAVLELRKSGFKVVEAETGEQAISLMKQGQRIDGLVTTIRLPGEVDGWEVAEAGRTIRPSMAVVYAATYSPAQTPVKGSLFVERPYRTNQVAMTLRAITGLRGTSIVTAAN